MRLVGVDNNITFTYRSVLKDLYRVNALPSVKFGLYGEKINKQTISVEHLKPVSRGGAVNDLFNHALASKELNNLRGNAPLRDFLDGDTALKYLQQFKDLKIKVLSNFSEYDFFGNDYIKGVTKTLERLRVFKR